MYYPILLNLEGKHVVVIGGGTVAFQKLKTLEGTKATITIISPLIISEIEKWIHQHNAKWLRKLYEPADIEKADMIIAATNDPKVNQTIRLHKKDRQLVLQVDNAKKGDFLVPAVVRRGKLSIAISTDGASPSLTKKIKKDIDQQFDDRFGEYVDFLHEARQFILKEIQHSERKRSCLKRLLDPIFYDLTMEEKYMEREHYLKQLIKEVEQ